MKFKICIIAILIASVLAACSNAIQTNASKTEINASSLNDNKTDITSSTVVSTESLKSSFEIIKTKSGKPEKFEDGIWIKKYPENFTSFKIETPSGFKIITDPFKMDEEVYADIVTESHNDGDHTDVSKIKGSYKLLKTVGEFNEKGINITGVLGWHNNSTLPAGNVKNIIFVFEIDGMRVVQFASMGAMPRDEEFNKIGRADIIILQVCGGGDKLNTVECREIVKRVNAKIIIPAHGDTTLAKRFASFIGGVDECAKSGEIIIKKSDIESIKIPKVLVLDN